MTLTVVDDGGRNVLDAVFNSSNPEIVGAAVFGTYIASAPMYFSLWAKADETPDRFRSLASTMSHGGWVDGLSIYWNSATTIKAAFSQYNVDVLSGTIATPSLWNHIVMGHDGADSRLWINGALVSTDVSSGFASAVAPMALYAAPVNLPGIYVIGGAFGGRLDDVRVFDRVLTAGEIAEIASGRGLAGPAGIAVDVLTQYETLSGQPIYAATPAVFMDPIESNIVSAPDRAILSIDDRAIVPMKRRQTHMIGAADRTIRVIQ
jgi:hypothetical protein